MLHLLHMRSGIHHQAILYQTRRMHWAHFIPDHVRLLRAMTREIVPVGSAHRAGLLQHALQFLIGCSLHNYSNLITKLQPLLDYITPYIPIKKPRRQIKTAGYLLQKVGCYGGVRSEGLLPWINLGGSLGKRNESGKTPPAFS